MSVTNQMSKDKIKELSKDFDKLEILKGPAQYGVVLSDNISTTIHFHNYIDDHKRLPYSETKLEF